MSATMLESLRGLDAATRNGGYAMLFATERTGKALLARRMVEREPGRQGYWPSYRLTDAGRAAIAQHSDAKGV